MSLRDLEIGVSGGLSPIDEELARFYLHHGAVVVANESLEIFCEGDILIAGELHLGPGSSILLKSRTVSIYVFGTVKSGDGQLGKNGGNVTLHAAKDIHLHGSIRGGKGGNGVNVEFGQTALGGTGGKGGFVTVKSDKLLVRGRVQSGDGGQGGFAQANELQTAVEEIPLFLRDPQQDPPGPFVFPLDLVPGNEFGGAVDSANARGGDGNVGGQLTFDSQTIAIYQSAYIKAGDGGSSGGAMASGGKVSLANSGAPANGGDIRWVGAPGSSGAIGPVTLRLGKGGWARRTEAYGQNSANAEVQNGGNGGQMRGQVPNGVLANVGQGGGCQKVLAAVQNSRDVRDDESGQGAQPARGAVKHVP